MIPFSPSWFLLPSLFSPFSQVWISVSVLFLYSLTANLYNPVVISSSLGSASWAFLLIFILIILTVLAFLLLSVSLSYSHFLIMVITSLAFFLVNKSATLDISLSSFVITFLKSSS